MASLSCHHQIALAQIHRDGESAWCYLCEAEVAVIGWRAELRTPCPDHRPVLDSEAGWYCAACGSDAPPI
jgi:hypothetical protein